MKSWVTVAYVEKRLHNIVQVSAELGFELGTLFLEGRDFSNWAYLSLHAKKYPWYCVGYKAFYLVKFVEVYRLGAVPFFSS